MLRNIRLKSLLVFIFFLYPLYAQAAPVYPVRVLRELLHDPSCFTQGLVMDGEDLIESSGLYGHSWITRYKPGEAHGKKIHLPGHLFAEGIALVGKKCLLLTWKERVYLEFDPRTLQFEAPRPYPGEWKLIEGWGMASDGKRLAISDGSSRILLVHPETLALTGEFRVRDNGKEIRNLNELEFARGILYANVWYQDRVAAIAPDSGKVLYWLDLAPLRPRLVKDAGVANGIAWDEKNGFLYLTGKNWDKLFSVALP